MRWSSMISSAAILIIGASLAFGQPTPAARPSPEAAPSDQATPTGAKRSACRQEGTTKGMQHYDVLADGTVVGRFMMFADTPAGKPWMWSLAYGQHEDRTPTHGYEPTREVRHAGIREELEQGLNDRGIGKFVRENDKRCRITETGPSFVSHYCERSFAAKRAIRNVGARTGTHLLRPSRRVHLSNRQG